MREINIMESTKASSSASASSSSSSSKRKQVSNDVSHSAAHSTIPSSIYSAQQKGSTKAIVPNGKCTLSLSILLVGVMCNYNHF